MKVKAKQLDINSLPFGIVPKRIVSGVTFVVPDGYQYVVHGPTAEIIGDLVLEGDAEFRIHE